MSCIEGQIFFDRVELQLPDLVPEDASVTTFRMTRKRKKLSISEFERAADKRLPQNQGKDLQLLSSGLLQFST